MTGVTPYPFQREGVNAMHLVKERYGGALRVLLADDPGLGKTLMSLLALKETPGALPALVFCPASLKVQWQEEAYRLVGYKSLILEGTKARLGPQVLKDYPLTIVNYDIVKGWQEVLLRVGYKSAVVDEVHRIRNYYGKQSVLVRQILQKIRHVIAMSGTAVVNLPIELWPIISELWPLEFDSIFDFGDLYCEGDRNRGRMRWGGARNLKHLHERLLKCGMIRRTKAEVLPQLPRKRRYTLNLPLSKPKEYERAQKDFVGWLLEWTGKPMAVRSAERAMQFAEFNYMRRLTSELKMPAVIEWLEDRLQGTDDKILVACVHRQSKPFTLPTLYGQFRDLAVQIHGGVSAGERERAKRAFKTSKECRLLFGQIRACGEGLNLQEGHCVVHVELDWNPAVHKQFTDRIYRIGLEHPVDEVFLLAKGTVEEKVARIIQGKENITSTILDGKRDRVEGLYILDELTKLILQEQE